MKSVICYTKEYTWMDILKRYTHKLGHQENVTISSLPQMSYCMFNTLFTDLRKSYFFNKLI